MNPRRVSTGGWAYAGLLLFIFVVYSNPGNWFDGMEDVGFAKIAAALSVVALGGSWLFYNRRLTIGGWAGAALISLFALVGFSALWSYWPRYTVDTFVDGLKYLAIFLLVANLIDGEARLRGVVRVLALASLIPAFGGIVSWSRGEHLVDGDRAGWIGIFGNPNDLAYHLVVGVALVLAAREAEPRRALRLAWLSALIPLGVAIMLTQSRGGMLASGVVLGLWVVSSLRRSGSSVAMKLAGLALTLGCVVYLAPGNPWSTRMESSRAYGEDVSARGRLDAWRTGLAIAADRPLTGVGAGAFMVAWPDYAPGDAGTVRSEHNTFIQLVGELGIPGLALFLISFVAGVMSAGRAARDPRLRPYARGVQCALAGFAVCSLSGGLAFSWPLYLLLGVALALKRMAPAPVEKSAAPPLALAGAQ
ncbi:MAG TPA: O-antigen ligase family protein [Polyangia bacterium]|nr:O-antigen ligase family protein [Polyangia bacterium]